MKNSYLTSSGVPLGGIGTGSVELRGDGRFYEWHIFNNGRWAWRKSDREKEFMTPRDLFFIIRTKTDDGVIRVRLLQTHRGYELGGDPYTLPWFRSLDKVEYNGEPPFIFLKYIDKDLPVKIESEVFSPFIPGDIKNSSLPIFFTIFKIRNDSSKTVEVSLLMGIKNPFSEIPGKAKIYIENFNETPLLTIMGEDIDNLHCMYRGSISIGFWGEDLKYGYSLTAPYDFREIRHKWVEFRANGLLKDERSSIEVGEKVYCIIACKKMLKPNEEAKVIGVLAWFFPNHYDDLNNYMGHIYEKYFNSSLDVAKYSMENFDYLYSYTRRFHENLYSTSIDYWLIDLIASQLTTLVKSTYYTKDGLFGVWEGYGCCGHNTTDVAFYGSIMILQLFPELEKIWIKYHAEWQLSPKLSPYYEVLSLTFPENMMLLKERLKKDPSIAFNLEKFEKNIEEVCEENWIGS